MFDIGWQELFVIAVLALIVVGPKDLPHAIRAITGWIRKARLMARDFQAGVNEMVREAELDDVKRSLTQPGDLKKTIAGAVDPDGSLAKGLVLNEEDERKLGSVPIKGATAHDTENMIVPGGHPDEAGPHVSVTPQSFDEDVMPVPVAEKKAESAL